MPAVELRAAAVRRQLETILKSAGFARNERLSRFLRFIVERHLEGRDPELKETVVGAEIFGRKPNYDPKRDAIVRTEARRLRALLNDYLLRDGKNDELIIELPKGGYVPLIRVGEAGQGRFGLRQLLRRPVWIGIGPLAVLAAIFVWPQFGSHTGPIPIAVPPLVNASQDSGSDYFADGLTSELISNLSIIEGLAVRSQTSSFLFKHQPRNIKQAGEQLRVDFILEGSVLHSATENDC